MVTRKIVQGLEFMHPSNEITRVRVMPGNPRSPHRVSQKPYVIVQRDGDFLDKYGKIVKERSDDSHIPLEDFNFKQILESKK